MTEPTNDPGPLAEVGVEPVGQRWTLVLTRDLGHSPEKVWSAVSDPERLRRWAPFYPDRELASTGPVMIIDNHAEDGSRTPGLVTRCEHPVLLEHSWEVDVLRWELEPTPTGTRLTLRHTLDQRHMVSQVAAGWHLCLNVADDLLAGRPTEPILGEDAMRYGWKALEEKYAEVLGIYQDPRR
jgi:uncharacterized protein YndB with AHSA1/START domain